MVGMDVVTGWVEEGELGELVKGLVARFGRREAGPSVLNGMDEIEREDSSDSADVEEVRLSSSSFSPSLDCEEADGSCRFGRTKPSSQTCPSSTRLRLRTSLPR
jgi:hypothetical protein